MRGRSERWREVVGRGAEEERGPRPVTAITTAHTEGDLKGVCNEPAPSFGLDIPTRSAHDLCSSVWAGRELRARWAGEWYDWIGG